MTTPKQTVIQMLISMLSSYVLLGDARVATLGGEGIEAEIWETYGIQPNHAWLVDRSPHRMKNLIRTHAGFRHFQGQLSKFGEILDGQHRSRGGAGLDFFHWDLCGTVEPVIDDIVQILPFIARGKGMCLAVTVADARRNLSLEHSEKVMKDAEAIFGLMHRKLFVNFLRLHRTSIQIQPDSCADPQNVAVREIGFALSMFSALIRANNGNGIAILPDRLERFLYRSRKFRMRTYVFHFARSTAHHSQADVAAAFLKLMMNASCSWVMDGGIIPITASLPTLPVITPVHSQPNTKESSMTAPSSRASNSASSSDALKSACAFLEATVLPILNTEAQRNLTLLLATVHRKSIDADDVITRAIAYIEGLRTAPASLVQAMNGSSPREAKVATKPQTKEKRKRREKNHPAVLSLEQGDFVRLACLEAKALGEEAFRAKQHELIERLDLKSKPRPLTVLAAICAHAYGKFRPSFFARLICALPKGDGRTAMAEKLANLYDLSTDSVLRMARSSLYWKQNSAEKDAAAPVS
ncbi:MAG: hypothetical protein AAB879_01120 [Patescibacteria group bacterium]